MSRSVRRLLQAVAGVVVLAAGLSFTSARWLPAIAQMLIRDEGAVKADIAVVLAGDNTGHRVMRGGELVRQGMAPVALVSGPVYYDMHECDAAIPFAVKRGYPAESFQAFPNKAMSTREEAQVVIPELERRGVRRFLLVTSDYHTGRAGRIFRAEARALRSTIEVHTVAAYDSDINAGNWWRNREGRKYIFMELVKTAASAVGL